MKDSGNTKKKKSIKKWISLGIGIVIVGGLVVTNVVNASKPMAAPVVKIDSADINSTVDTTGTVKAAIQKTYFSPINGTISEAAVEVGDEVAANDVLVVFDKDELDLQIKSAKLKKTAAQSEYNNTMELEQKNQDKYTNAETRINELTEALKKEERDYNDYQYVLGLRKEELVKKGATPEEIAMDKDILEYQKEVERLAPIVAERKADLESYKAEKKVAESSFMTDSAKTGVNARNELESITSKNEIENLESVKDGLKSDIDGLVVDSKIVNGMSVGAGTDLLTVADLNSLYVSISLSKAEAIKVKKDMSVDVEINGNNYTGTVERISKIAAKNETGATVVSARIAITNADENIILGAESKVKIHIAEAKGVVVISNELVNYGTDGCFVYVVREGVVVKQPITLGISSDMYSEVVDGLAIGDEVITGDTSIYTEGAPVTVIEE